MIYLILVAVNLTSLIYANVFHSALALDLAFGFMGFIAAYNVRVFRKVKEIKASKYAVRSIPGISKTALGIVHSLIPLYALIVICFILAVVTSNVVYLNIATIGLAGYMVIYAADLTIRHILEN